MSHLQAVPQTLPELTQRVVEYSLPHSFLAHAGGEASFFPPPPPGLVFVVDASSLDEGDARGVRDALKAAARRAPPDTPCALVSYGAAVHVALFDAQRGSEAAPASLALPPSCASAPRLLASRGEDAARLFTFCGADGSAGGGGWGAWDDAVDGLLRAPPPVSTAPAGPRPHHAPPRRRLAPAVVTALHLLAPAPAAIRPPSRAPPPNAGHVVILATGPPTCAASHAEPGWGELGARARDAGVVVDVLSAGASPCGLRELCSMATASGGVAAALDGGLARGAGGAVGACVAACASAHAASSRVAFVEIDIRVSSGFAVSRVLGPVAQPAEEAAAGEAAAAARASSDDGRGSAPPHPPPAPPRTPAAVRLLTRAEPGVAVCFVLDPPLSVTADERSSSRYRAQSVALQFTATIVDASGASFLRVVTPRSTRTCSVPFQLACASRPQAAAAVAARIIAADALAHAARAASDAQRGGGGGGGEDGDAAWLRGVSSSVRAALHAAAWPVSTLPGGGSAGAHLPGGCSEEVALRLYGLERGPLTARGGASHEGAAAAAALLCRADVELADAVIRPRLYRVAVCTAAAAAGGGASEANHAQNTPAPSSLPLPPLVQASCSDEAALDAAAARFTAACRDAPPPALLRARLVPSLLVPLPPVDLALDEHDVLVLDCGTEVCGWVGRSLSRHHAALRLARAACAAVAADGRFPPASTRCGVDGRGDARALAARLEPLAASRRDAQRRGWPARGGGDDDAALGGDGAGGGGGGGGWVDGGAGGLSGAQRASLAARLLPTDEPGFEAWLAGACGGVLPAQRHAPGGGGGKGEGEGGQPSAAPPPPPPAHASASGVSAHEPPRTPPPVAAARSNSRGGQAGSSPAVAHTLDV